MKKLLTGVCLISLMLTSMKPCLVAAEGMAATSTTNTKNPASISTSVNDSVSGNSVDSESGASEITNSDYDYSDDAGDNAAIADTALTAISAAVSVLTMLIHTQGNATDGVITALLSNPLSIFNTIAIKNEPLWNTFYFAWNPFESIIQLGHAAVNQFMRDETAITASFVGAEGHVTDKWIGAPATNKTYYILDDFDVPTQRFAKVAFDESEYSDLEDVDSADARTLMDYRNSKLVEEQRSLDNVTEETWGVRYRSQKRAITALVTALEAKATLSALASADAKVTAEYDSKTQAVATLAARRVLYDALMYLKMNVMAARTKMRAETLELDFKPLTTTPTDSGGGSDETVTNGVAQ